jgi:hypothetical protein
MPKEECAEETEPERDAEQEVPPVPQEETADETEAEPREARMVEPDMQPGSMRYPFATHRPPPEDEEGEEAASNGSQERRVSAAFVLGVLIIVAALSAGIALVVQQGRINSLERRVGELEQFFRAPAETEAANR